MASAGMPDLTVLVDDDRWSGVEHLEALARLVVHAGATFIEGGCDGEHMTLLFSSDAHVRALNHRFRGLDRPTNVLSFPAAPSVIPPDADGAAPALGDVILAFETVAREAELDNKAFHHHVMHLVLHGFLHLLGYDHENDADAEEMEQLERDILATLSVPDPYSDT